MKTSIFMPKKINVGYQERNGTYTGKLAYIIYFDEKGKLRKETSWQGWRDKSIDNDILENVPTEGFVLNKKAGGYDTGWNHRQTYVRVYDPRGFEFEITVPNLLYILDNATSTKGKGLEGEFVYGWDGKDLILIPCESPDYQELVKLNELRHKKEFVKAKDLKIGATYRTKDNVEKIYIGKFDEYSYSGTKSAKPVFWFATKHNNGYSFDTMKSISQKFVETISEECVSDYADIFDKLECDRHYSPIDESKTVYTPYTLEEFLEKFNESSWGIYVFSDNVSDRYEKGDKGRTEINEVTYSKEKGNYYYYDYENREREWGYSWNKQKERYWTSVQKYANTLEEIFNILQPQRKFQYLANDKLYGEVTY